MSRQELTRAIIACGGDAVKIQALLAANKTTSKTDNGLKVSPKGAVSLYGLGKFPITLYGSQWITLAEKLPEVLDYIDKHKAELKWKVPAETTATA